MSLFLQPSLPPSGTLTDVSLSYQSQGTVSKHFAMKMQRRGLFPPAKEGQLSEVMTAGGHADGTRGAPEERGCSLPSCSHRDPGTTLCSPSWSMGSLPGWGGRLDDGGHGLPQSMPRWQCRNGPRRSPFAVPACSLLLPLLYSLLSVASGSEM